MIPRYTPYAVARFDGALLFNSIQAGVMTTGKTKSPIVHFNVLAGIQTHPVWALDRLALIIYSYCQAARTLEFGETQLQVSVTASWVSGSSFSNLIVTHIEWHTASNIRKLVDAVLAEMEGGRKYVWPATSMSLPVQSENQT